MAALIIMNETAQDENSMAMSINVIGSHLAEHSPTQTKAEGMRQRGSLGLASRKAWQPS